MYLYAVAGSKTAKIMALFTLLAVIITLLPVSAFAQETTDVDGGAEPIAKVAKTLDDETEDDENHLEVTVCHSAGQSGNYTLNTVDEDSIDDENGHGLHEDDIIPPFGDFLGLNWDEEGQAIWDNDCVAPEDETEEDPREACEIEGHKYDAKGNPLTGWAIGLMKVITFAEDTQTADLDEDVTDTDGYYCLEWDGYSNTEVIEEPHSFSYRVYEILKAGWNYLSVEEGADAENLSVVDDEDILVEDGRVSVQIGEENGYIYANAEHHVDFYNATTTEIDPCDEDDEISESVSRVVEEDPCDTDGDDTHTIDGYKFNDKNGNGVWDIETEDGIEGWEIVLTQGDADPQYDITDKNGYYSFAVEDGSYQVTETQQKGWEQTAVIGENVDGDTCYITVDEIEYTQAAVIEDVEDIDYDNTCIFGNKQTIVAPICETGDNLLINGSFEDPAVAEGDWDIFETVAGWTIAMSDGLELWANGFYGGASEGEQNAELDGNSPTKITQMVTTVPGATYELRFDFSARPDADSAADNSVDGLVNGAAIMNATANGSDITENTWSTYSETFVAATATTEVGFEDKGTANSLGSLIDNAVVCLIDTPDGGGDGDGGDDNSSNRGGGTRIKRAPTGEVLGAQATTPAGLVLGDATSTLPVGAPNTGAGGTATVSVSLPTILAILPKTTKVK